MAVIELEHFSKAYGKFLAVDEINLSIEKGEIVGFVGKNGAGKSTTIRSMVNMIFPTSGKITIDGMDSVKDAKKIKKRLSYMPSDSSYYENVTSEELFKLCLKFSNEGFDRARELSEYFELDCKKKISELSMGNRKKVSIIQALLKSADIIILDEPTSGLDPLMQNMFFELIHKEREKGATVFLSSHNLSEIEKYCDKVIIIKDGKIVDYLDMKNRKVKHKQTVLYTTKDGISNTLEYSGDINSLISDLSKLELETLEIKNSSVEEEFIKYYKEDGANE
ncbi:MAG: ABC transporter ATP-binding protein [Oscillospiraceae bacterium]|nr:ABC transporter ATP-binding protein [Oscillospiraceae bacterium]